MNRTAWGAGLVLAIVFGTEARAGGPPPICMAVEKIVLEPNDQAPMRIQIWGTFALCKDNAKYGSPISGYLYYTVQQGKEEECRKEWAKLQQLVAEKHVVAFGACGHPKVDGHLRKTTDKPRSPVIFPLSEPGFTDADNYAREFPAIKKLQKGVDVKTSGS